ncbi:MAG: hypothetical protein AAGG38_02240 [Planctomycetota bacterium]
MLFQVVLIAVMGYLAACYVYGLYLLWKLYTGRRLHADAVSLGENPRTAHETPEPVAARSESDSAYGSTAKAA